MFLISAGHAAGASSRFRKVLEITALVFCAVAPTAAAAQDTSDASFFWGPPQRAIGIGISTVVDDSESSTPFGVWWYGHNRLSIGATGQFWNDYNVVQSEVRWFLSDSVTIRPYLAGALSWQTHGSAEGYGLAVGVGGEIYFLERIAYSVALGWRSLLRRSRLGGVENPQDVHWFRLTQALVVFPFR